MKNLKQHSKKVLAFALSILMIFYIIPSSVYANMFQDYEKSNQDFSGTLVNKDVFELTNRREESVKHFQLEDGSIMAVQYADAVHRMDEDGGWQDIDNTLSAKGSEFSTSDARVKFAKKITGNESLFTLHEHNHKITMSLNDAKKKTAGVITNTSTEFDENATQLQKLMTLDKLSANILYADILDGVDLEYVVASNDIKENIIVKEQKESYTYTFTIKLNNLEAELTEAGSVAILDSDSGETIYVIPAPIVYDSNDVYANSEDAFYTLTQSENNTYAFSVTVNADWMNNKERAFPVVVDPTIGVAQSNVVDLDITKNILSESAPSSPSLFVSENWRTYWKINNLPKIPTSAYIVNASISLKRFSGSGNYVGVYQVLSDWDSTLNWNKTQSSTLEGQLSSTLLDYNHIIANNSSYGKNGWFTWNLTGLVKSWYNETDNYGIAFAPVAFTSASSDTCFYSTDTTTVLNRPQFSITYKDMKGVEDYWSYSSQSAGLAGTGYINRATGSLTFAKGLLSTTDSLFSYTPTLVYSSTLVTTENNSTQLRSWSYPYAQTASQNSYLPLGFKWNMQETLIKKEYYKPDGSSSDFYIWSDADGTEHYFFAVGNSPTEYEDEDGLQLKLSIDNNNSICTISDDSKTTKVFTPVSTNPGNDVLSGWYLNSITDKNGNKLSFTPNNDPKPTEVCLTPNGSTEITFLTILYTNGLPYVIWNDVSKEAIIFRYSATPSGNITTSGEQYLRELVYAHGDKDTTATNWLNFYNDSSITKNITFDGKAIYTYNESGYLIGAEDAISDYRISYTYTNGKVSSVKEYGQNSSLGQEIRLTYNDGYTEVRTSGADDVILNMDDLITRYTFDREGRVASAYTTDNSGTQFYGGSAGTYETDRKVKNNIKDSVAVGGSATNYLLNGGFESNQSLYVADHWISSSNNVRYTGSYAQNGGYGASFHIQSNTTDSISQYTRLPEGPYTLSMIVNTHNCQNVTAYVIVYSLTRARNVLVEEIPINENYVSGSSSIFSTSFNAEYNHEGTEDFRVTIQVTGGSTVASSGVSFSIDNVMLENNIGNSNYSMVEYGNFEEFSINSYGNNISNITNYWEGDDSIFDSPTVSAPFGRVLQIPASLTEDRYIKQTFYQISESELESYDQYDLYSGASAITYTVSGFAKGTGQVASTNSAFRLRVDVKYYNNEIDSFCFDFQNDCKDWQFVCGTFTTREGGPVVFSIDIYCEYNHQPTGYAMFDNIAVFQSNDDSVVRYRYYTDNPNFQNHQYYHVEYNPTLAGLVHVRESGYYTEIYEYNNDRQLVRKINNRGELYEYTYADNGVDIENEVYYKFTSYYPFLAENPDASITKTPKTRTDYSYNAQGLCNSIDSYEAIYNGNGQVVEKPNTMHLNYERSYCSTAGSRIFGALYWEMDTLGIPTRYFYDESNGRLLACVNEWEGTGTCYTYDSIGNLEHVFPARYVENRYGISYQEITNAEAVSYFYNAQNRLEEVATESTVYSFSYDSFGNAAAISAGSNQLVGYQYNATNGKLNTVVYGNGYAEKYVYDKLDSLKEVWYTINYQGNDTSWTKAYEYTYTAYGQLYRFDNLLIEKSIIYKYNTSGKMTNFVEFDSTDYVNEFSSSIYYNDDGRVSSLFYKFDYPCDSMYSVVDGSYRCFNLYAYYSDGSLQYNKVETETTDGRIDYSYDTFKRPYYQTTDFYVKGNSTQRFTNTVSYEYSESDYTYNSTSMQVSSYTSQVNSGAVTTYQYFYDNCGNITRIEDADYITHQYVYDDLGQLIREDNRQLGKTYVYTYDNAGNRTSKSTYNFTTGSLGALQSTETYTYADNDWGDLLTSYTSGISTYSITYDEIGNPTYIADGNGNDRTLEWKGRRLVFSANRHSGNLRQFDKTYYTYNADGIRTSKYNYSQDEYHAYYLDGSRIIMEVVFEDSDCSEERYRLIYIYDANGSPIGMQYRDPCMAEGSFYTFWFEKNLQGDIVAVYNESGTKLISYTYDAWGNFSTTNHNITGSNYHATYNSFRYRGYYYDIETGYYYLQSRYYNPQWGRFINADGYVSTGTGLLGYNMFAYCNNNPVMYVDYCGDVFGIIIGLALLLASTCILLQSCQTVSREERYYFSAYDSYEDAYIAGMQQTFEAASKVDFDYEYGCVIVQYSNDDKFYLSNCVTDKKLQTVDLPFPKNATAIADIHSHPWYLSEPYTRDGVRNHDQFIVDREKSGYILQSGRNIDEWETIEWDVGK